MDNNLPADEGRHYLLHMLVYVVSFFGFVGQIVSKYLCLSVQATAEGLWTMLQGLFEKPIINHFIKSLNFFIVAAL